MSTLTSHDALQIPSQSKCCSIRIAIAVYTMISSENIRVFNDLRDT